MRQHCLETWYEHRLHLDRARLALEPVRHIDLVLLVVIAVGENIGALDGLVKVSEDVVDNDNSLGCIGRAGDIYPQSVGWPIHSRLAQEETYRS